MEKQTQKCPKGKVAILQCTSARLKVASDTPSQCAQFVEIGRGIIIFVCFLKDANLDTVERMAKWSLNVRLSGDYCRRVSVLEMPGDVLIFPQSTLGGRRKGRRMAYDSLLDKDSSCQLYEAFVQKCRNILAGNPRSYDKVVCSGTYNNKEEDFVMQCDGGPFTHTIEV